MEVEFIDWTSVLVAAVLMCALLKLVAVVHAMAELRAGDDPRRVGVLSTLRKASPLSIYRSFQRIRYNGFSFARGIKRSWQIQVIMAPFWIVASFQGVFLEFSLLFALAMTIAVVFGMAFSESKVESGNGHFA